MHPRIIAQRQAAAHSRVLAAVGLIAANTSIKAPDLAGIREKSPDVQRIKEWEALADWLEGVAAQTKVPEPEEPEKTAQASPEQGVKPAKAPKGKKADDKT